MLERERERERKRERERGCQGMKRISKSTSIERESVCIKERKREREKEREREVPRGCKKQQKYVATPDFDLRI